MCVRVTDYQNANKRHKEYKKAFNEDKKCYLNDLRLTSLDEPSICSYLDKG